MATYNLLQAWELIQRAHDGDTDAYAEIYIRHHKKIFNFIRRRVPNRDVAEELTQEVFTKTLRYFRQHECYQGTADPISIQITVARNLVADHYKCLRHRLTATHVPAEWWEPDGLLDRPDPRPDPLDQAWTRDALLAAVRQLRPDQQRAVTLRYLLDMPFADVAAEMNLSIGAAKALCFRAVRQLAKTLNALEVVA
jgi:RNA polymerase sigma-70 factor (ECF subfamily)